MLDVPFEMRAVASSAGARWDKTHRAHLFAGKSLPPSLKPFQSKPHSLERRLERELNAQAGESPGDSGTGQITPRPHQVDAISLIDNARSSGLGGFLLADDVGLGKTISAWQAVLNNKKAKTVLVVCPLAVVAHWRKTIAQMGDGGKEIVVLNYERVGKLLEVPTAATRKVKSAKGLARVGKAPSFDVVIWDESHRCKNPTTARSKMAVKINAEAGFVMWLSATAGQNPLELSYLAPLLARATGDKPGDLRDFEAWCQKQGFGVHRGDYGRWEWGGAEADCAAIRKLLFEGIIPAGIRRRPEDIAGWPEINRILTPIELDSSARALYDELWTTFRREMELDPEGQRNPASGLAAVLRFRQKSSLLRVPGTVDLVHELLENGHQVAVSVAFIETLDAIQDTLESDLGEGAVAVIHGQLSATDREDERLRFQRGQCRVVLFTVEEGISLHQGESLIDGPGSDIPRSEIIHDLRWSAIQMAQIEGRCHRDGRYAPVFWAYADDTIEERIAGVVCRRLVSMKSMIGDDIETVQEIERLLSQG
ncbi:MAG: DEAD/DEAH box helicase [Myxococcales bacterium]|nr:DEAD/DEAH box helicase [Myxococcales bacterium]